MISCSIPTANIMINTVEIINLYNNGLSCRQIQKKLNVKRKLVSKILKNNNIILRSRSDSARKYKSDDDYFQQIDTEDKAYFLGLLYADGYNDIKRGVVSISLQEKDLDILEKFKNYLKIENPIYYIKPKKYSGYHTNPYYTIKFVNHNISKDLDSLGVIKNKTYKCSFPYDKIPERLFNHFIRGMLDGDGCITIEKKSMATRVYICGRRSLIAPIWDIIYKNTSVTYREFPLSKIYKDPEFCILGTSGNNLSKVVLDWIYGNSTIYLERKHNKYLQLLERVKTRQHKVNYEWAC